MITLSECGVIMSSFKSRFLQLKSEKEMNYDEISKAINFNKSSLIKVVNGQYKLNQDLIESLANYFDVDQAYLLGESNIRRQANKLPQIYMEVSEKAFREGIPPETIQDMIEFYLKNRNK